MTELKVFYKTIGEGGELEQLSALVSVFHGYMQGNNELPKDVVLCAANYLEQYLFELENREGSGRWPDSPFESGLFVDAVKYLLYCRDGKIDDDSPRKTVALSYEVNWEDDKGSSTVNNWWRKYKDRAQTELEKNALDTDCVVEVMKASAKQYNRVKPYRTRNRI